MVAYYNEIEPYAAEWIKNLIAAGLVTSGDVDTRSIVDVRPEDLVGYSRCHFFAGIAVWDYALGLAGWPAERPVWTGSCPCQPFSAAGKGSGFADERHLWPAWHHLIRECRPATVLGEQVASKDGLGWLDLVHADLEGEGYAVGAADLCAAGVGAPHIRQRLWFVADTADSRQLGRQDARADCRHSRALQGGGQGVAGLREPQRGGDACLVAESAGVGLPARPQQPSIRHGTKQSERQGVPCVVGNAERQRLRGEGRGPDAKAARGVSDPDRQREWLRDEPRAAGGACFWSDADWIACRDGKARPVEPGTFPLAHGAPARVGRLRAYGNAIVAEAAAAFIGACLEVRP